MPDPPFLEGIPKPWKFLAPMVSNSEEAYRRLARRYGADLCFTEMINSKVFLEQNRRAISPDDRPLVVQICGNDPDKMLTTALAFQEECDAIDINFGCPQEIARRGHYGSFLQDEWDTVASIVSKLSSALTVPLFCKIRIFDSVEKTVEYARMIERSGCALLTVHGRTREQRGQLTGLASWNHIRAVKQALSIPVIANGNMIYHENIQQCVDFTGCDGVMIAEPHLYNPLIFTGLQLGSLEIFREYLEIVQTYQDSAEFKHVKSHSFKIFRRLLTAHPHLLLALDGCHSLEDFLKFIGTVQNMDIPAEDHLMGPYIRRL